MPLSPVVVVGPVYAASERGLAADVLVARALGLAPLPICTSIVVASEGRVTDVTAVPVDTVRAQLEHLGELPAVAGIKVGALGDARTVEAVMETASAMSGPCVLDVVTSGPSGETVLDARGIDAVSEHLGVPDLVTLSKADAELVTNTEIASLDDAQVAAQRLAHRGARGVVIRCGSLPYRFYDPAEDPGAGERALSADLFYDGEDFALFEAPLLDADPDGASSAFALGALAGLIRGDAAVAALQSAKRIATEAVRQAEPVAGYSPRIGGLATFGDAPRTQGTHA